MGEKIVVITGSGGVIGLVCTEAYLNAGHRVFACYNSQRSKDGLLTLKNKYENQLELISDFDIASPSSRNVAITQIKEKTKFIDILINMTGILGVESFFKIGNQALKRTFDINFFGAIEFTQQIAKLMLLRKTTDRSIIFISSVSVRLSNPGRLTYIASKAAIESSVKVLAKELGPYRIRVNAISPGLIESDMLNNNTSDQEIKNMILLTPLGRIGAPEDVVNAIYFLSSESASFITGQIISVDGGI